VHKTDAVPTVIAGQLIQADTGIRCQSVRVLSALLALGTSATYGDHQTKAGAEGLADDNRKAVPIHCNKQTFAKGL
jgi:hypothetical protein